MNLIICEGSTTNPLPPLTDTRPIFDLICGSMSLMDRIIMAYDTDGPVLGVRDSLLDLTVESHDRSAVNVAPPSAALIVNGSVLWTPSLAAAIPLEGPDTIYRSGGTNIAARVSSHDWSSTNFADPFAELSSDLPIVELDAVVMRHLWDIVRESPERLAVDLERHPQLGQLQGSLHNTVQLIAPENIGIAAGASVGAGSVLDASDGPIVIAEGAAIGHLVTITGPVFLGPHSVIKAHATISLGTFIGESCKVGGEVAESTLHSFSNKQHDGFLGHSYVGSWVNIGAGTNNSNLRNDYGSVKVWAAEQPADSGEMFMGCIIGDHSKIGIGMAINTGTVIGVGCNLYGLKMIQKYIPNFSWGQMGELVPFRIEKFIDIAKIVMTRRNQTVSPAMESHLRKMHGEIPIRK